MLLFKKEQTNKHLHIHLSFNQEFKIKIKSIKKIKILSKQQFTIISMLIVVKQVMKN